MGGAPIDYGNAAPAGSPANQALPDCRCETHAAQFVSRRRAKAWWTPLRSAAKEETMSTSGRSLRKKRELRALDRRQQSKLPLDRADELILGDGTCGPRRSGFIMVTAGDIGIAEMVRKQG
jgi:hypothetical protein